MGNDSFDHSPDFSNSSLFKVADGLRLSALDTGCSAVFDTLTWQTHVISGAAARVLDICLRYEQLSFREIISHLNVPEEDATVTEQQALTSQALDELLLVHLLYPVDSGAREFPAAV